MYPPSVCVPSPLSAYVFFPWISYLVSMSSKRGSMRPRIRPYLRLRPELSFKVAGTFIYTSIILFSTTCDAVTTTNAVFPHQSRCNLPHHHLQCARSMRWSTGVHTTWNPVFPWSRPHHLQRDFSVAIRPLLWVNCYELFVMSQSLWVIYCDSIAMDQSLRVGVGT